MNMNTYILILTMIFKSNTGGGIGGVESINVTDIAACERIGDADEFENLIFLDLNRLLNIEPLSGGLSATYAAPRSLSSRTLE